MVQGFFSCSICGKYKGINGQIIKLGAILPVQHSPGILEAGLDEAGRGCLAGPVVAGAVILPEDFKHPGLDDSKKLSHKQRLELREIIQENAISWAIGILSHARIDEVNILKASLVGKVS